MKERPKMDAPAAITALLAGLDGKVRPRPKMCGGAIIPVTRDTWQAHARRYDVDLKLPDEPPLGTFDARVACDREVLETMGVGGALVQIATCARCAGIEESVRRMLAEVAARAQEGPR